MGLVPLDVSQKGTVWKGGDICQGPSAAGGTGDSAPRPNPTTTFPLFSSQQQTIEMALPFLPIDMNPSPRIFLNSINPFPPLNLAIEVKHWAIRICRLACKAARPRSGSNHKCSFTA
jgi:hypothetical protein